MVQETRLEPAHHARHPTHDFPGTVDEEAVDDGAVAYLPQTHAQTASAFGQNVFVDPVHVVLVLHDHDQRTQCAGKEGWHFGVDQVHVPSGDHTGQSQPERRHAQAVNCHGHWTMEQFAQLLHRGVLGRIDEDDILEEVPIQHGADRHVANYHRRNRQQDEWHRHHPRRLVRFVVAMIASVIVVTVVVIVAMVRVRVLVVTLRAMEDQEIHAERIESRDKHPRQHRKVGKASGRQGAQVHGFDDAVLGVKTREQGRADQRQRAQQGGDPGDGHVLA